MKILFLPAMALMLLAGCEPKKATETKETSLDSVVLSEDYSPGNGTQATDTTLGNTVPDFQKNGLRLFAVTNSPAFPESRLEMDKPAASDNPAAGPVTFEYSLKGYELTKQTDDAAHKNCANSKEGQHIHNIVDNEPYTAHYTTTFTKDLKEGNHVVLSFLSRSYHESLKHKGAYVLRNVKVGNAKGKPADLSQPTLFYSRPKGEYKGDDTKRVLLDFYLVNTNLSADGNKVKATINGTDFMITKWQPYLIEGLKMGQNTIKLELLDKNNKVIPGAYNTVERTITLLEK